MVDCQFFKLYWKHVPYISCTSLIWGLQFISIFLDWTSPSAEMLKFESPSKWNSYEGFNLEHWGVGSKYVICNQTTIKVAVQVMTWACLPTGLMQPFDTSGLARLGLDFGALVLWHQPQLNSYDFESNLNSNNKRTVSHLHPLCHRGRLLNTQHDSHAIFNYVHTRYNLRTRLLKRSPDRINFWKSHALPCVSSMNAVYEF